MAVQIPKYWREEEFYQPLVKSVTAFGNEVEIPQRIVECWEMWLEYKEQTVETFQRAKADGWPCRSTNRIRIRARDYEKVFIEDYHE